MKNYSIIALAAIMLFGCTKVKMDNNYNESTVEKDLASLVKYKILTDEDVSLIKDYISSWNIATEDSISYERLLSSAKMEKERKEKNKRIQEELDSSMSVRFVKKYYTYDWQSYYITFDVKATNNTTKKINGFKFSAEIKDGLGNYLQGWSWNTSNIIKANSSRVINKFTVQFDNSDDNLVKIMAAELDKLQIEYHVLSIFYDDGTSIEIEE